MPELPELLSGLAGPDPAALDLDAIAGRSNRITQRRRLAASLTAGTLCIAAIGAVIVATRPSSTIRTVEPAAPIPTDARPDVSTVVPSTSEPMVPATARSATSRGDDVLLAAAEAIVGQPEVGYRRWAWWSTAQHDGHFEAEGGIIEINFSTRTSTWSGGFASELPPTPPTAAGDADAVALLEGLHSLSPELLHDEITIPDTQDTTALIDYLATIVSGPFEQGPMGSGIAAVFLRSSATRATQATYYRAIADAYDVRDLGSHADRFGRVGRELVMSIALLVGDQPTDTAEAHLLIDADTGQLLATWLVIFGVDAVDSRGVPVPDPMVLWYVAIVEEGANQLASCALACFVEPDPSKSAYPMGDMTLRPFDASLLCPTADGCFWPMPRHDGTLVSFDSSKRRFTILESPPRTFVTDAPIDPTATYLLAIGPDDVAYLSTKSDSPGDYASDLIAISTAPETAGAVVGRIIGGATTSGDSELRATAAGLVSVGCCGGEPRQPTPDRSRVVMEWVDRYGKVIVDDGPEIWIDYLETGGIRVTRRDDSAEATWTIPDAESLRGMPPIIALDDGGVMLTLGYPFASANPDDRPVRLVKLSSPIGKNAVTTLAMPEETDAGVLLPDGSVLVRTSNGFGIAQPFDQ